MATEKTEKAEKTRSGKKFKKSATDAVAGKVQLHILDANGKEVGSREVSASIFAVPVKTALLNEVVRWQRAKKRAGTHSTMTRAEMSGGGAKPWKQKGTGRARAGSNTSPLWVGGGIAHGPKPRKYDFGLNASERKVALRSALSARALEGGVIVVKEYAFKDIKTSAAVKFLRNVGVAEGKGALVLVDQSDEKTNKSLRNVEGVKLLAPAGLNVLDVLKASYVVMTEEALTAIENRLS